MPSPPAVTLLVTAAVLSAGCLLLWRRRQRQRTTWTPAGRLREIHTYPLKSGAGTTHRTARITNLGLRDSRDVLDRCLAVVCEGQVMCASHRRRLVLIHADVTPREVTLSAEGQPSLTVSLPQPSDDVKPIKVGLSDGYDAGVDLGEEISKWVTNFFADGKSYSMIYFMPEKVTPRKTINLPRPYTYLADPKDIMTYNFVSPVTALVVSSLNALNSRMETPITAGNFRQNLIIDGAPAFDDDSWRVVRVGTAVLRYMKPIHRCGVTLVDPIAGTVSKKMEPLKTLRKFRPPRNNEEMRIYKEAPLFGSCFGVEVEGDVSVGDVVYVKRQ